MISLADSREITLRCNNSRVCLSRLGSRDRRKIPAESFTSSNRVYTAGLRYARRDAIGRPRNRRLCTIVTAASSIPPRDLITRTVRAKPMTTTTTTITDDDNRRSLISRRPNEFDVVAAQKLRTVNRV